MPKPCPFCTRAMYEERLVLETGGFSIIASLGQAVEGYLLIVPKRHLPCIGDLGPVELDAFLEMKTRAKDALERGGYGPSICFEHGDAGQSVPHAHMHVVPAPVDLHAATTALYPAWRDAPDAWALADARRSGGRYLMYEDRSGRVRIYDVEDVRPQHFRIVLAEALGTPEWADWKTADRSEDERRWRRTVARLRGKI